MDPNTQQTVIAAAGAAAGGDPVYVDDVFSTYLYDGTGAAQTITNGIDLSGEGGLVWLKQRDVRTRSHALIDTARGSSKWLASDLTSPEGTDSAFITSFNNNGFSIGAANNINQSGSSFASWSFRKAPGWFDVVSYTGDGNASKTLSHSLGSTPGFIIVKRTDAAGPWQCFHTSLGNQHYIQLNGTSAASTLGTTVWGVSSTDFTVYGAATDTNISSASYIAYVFAHDDQSFGTNEDESIIKCGSYVESSSTLIEDLGFEPQWVMIKNTSSGGDWEIHDVMRGSTLNGQDKLRANTSDSEASQPAYLWPTVTGFNTPVGYYGAGGTMIYMAIRRPHKPPTAATEVFSVGYGLKGAANGKVYDSGFPVDLNFFKNATGASSWYAIDRLGGANYLLLNSSAAEAAIAYSDQYDHMDGVYTTTAYNYTNWIGYQFKRAPGFFDIVTYKGNQTARTITHSLGVVPEFMLVKNRDFGWQWCGYSTVSGAGKSLRLYQDVAAFTAAFWNSTAPTSSVFTVGTDENPNANGNDYVAYLFATLSGISKVGSYSGTGNNIDIDCGFTAGARFVLIKRTDAAGSWYVFDSTRGIVSGNDPYLKIDVNSAQGTGDDEIDPLSTGFTVASTASNDINASGGTYFFLAIA